MSQETPLSVGDTTKSSTATGPAPTYRPRVHLSSLSSVHLYALLCTLELPDEHLTKPGALALPPENLTSLLGVGPESGCLFKALQWLKSTAKDGNHCSVFPDLQRTHIPYA